MSTTTTTTFPNVQKNDISKRYVYIYFFYLFPNLMAKPFQLLGDSMSKVWEKRSTSKSGFLFNEMWKIIGQIDDFDSFLNNSCNLGVF